MIAKLRKQLLTLIRKRTIWYASVYARVIETMDQVEEGAM
jgi:hypothetical protein